MVEEVRLDVCQHTNELALRLGAEIRKMRPAEVQKLERRLCGSHKMSKSPTAGQVVTAMALIGASYVDAIEKARDQRVAELAKQGDKDHA